MTYGSWQRCVFDLKLDKGGPCRIHFANLQLDLKQKAAEVDHVRQVQPVRE